MSKLCCIQTAIRKNINTAISDFNVAYSDVIEDTFTGDSGKIETYDVFSYESNDDRDEVVRGEIEDYLDYLQEVMWDALEKILPPSFKPYVTWDVERVYKGEGIVYEYTIDIGYTIFPKIPFLRSLADCGIDC